MILIEHSAQWEPIEGRAQWILIEHCAQQILIKHRAQWILFEHRAHWILFEHHALYSDTLIRACFDNSKTTLHHNKGIWWCSHSAFVKISNDTLCDTLIRDNFWFLHITILHPHD